MNNQKKSYAEEIASTSDLQTLSKIAEQIAWEVTKGYGIECNCSAGDDTQSRGVAGCEGSCTNSQVIAFADALKSLSAGGEG